MIRRAFVRLAGLALGAVGLKLPVAEPEPLIGVLEVFTRGPSLDGVIEYWVGDTLVYTSKYIPLGHAPVIVQWSEDSDPGEWKA